MICSYCNRVIPDGSQTCVYCNTRVDLSLKRCPDCWVRLEDNQKTCHNCGCDVDVRLEEIHRQSQYKVPTLWEKIKKFPLWIKIAIPVLLIALTVAMFVYSVAEEKARLNEAVSLAEDFVVAVEISMGDVTKLAYAYENMVYDQSWLDHLGSATAVRDVYKDEISVAKKARELVDYNRNQVVGCGNVEISVAADEVYRNYTSCYGYVIGEGGTYPEYMDGYNKILKEYNKAVENLKLIIEKYEQ